MDQNNLPLDPCHKGVPLGVSKVISEPVVRSAQTVHVSCVKINTMSKQTEQLGVPICVPIKISMPLVRSAQTVHLSFTDINTTTKWTKTSIHLTHVT